MTARSVERSRAGPGGQFFSAGSPSSARGEARAKLEFQRVCGIHNPQHLRRDRGLAGAQGAPQAAAPLAVGPALAVRTSHNHFWTAG